jgi:hypothetical protein
MAAGMFQQVAKAGRNWEPTWRYLFNFTPTVKYKIGGERLAGEAARVLRTLNRDGVAVTSASKLLGDTGLFDALCADVDARERKQAAAIAEARAAIERPVPGQPQKEFIFPLLGPRPMLNLQDVHVRFALETPLLQIANAYFEMYTRLRFYNVWHTFTTQGSAHSSQLWHADRDDLHYVLKVFVNLSDVDDGAGPFTYAPGTHAKGSKRTPPAALFNEGNTARSDDTQMAEVVRPQDWVTSIGPRGTIVFADTRGYHKGGLARRSDRIMYTCMFGSSTALVEMFDRPANLAPPTDPAQAFALQP